MLENTSWSMLPVVCIIAGFSLASAQKSAEELSRKVAEIHNKALAVDTHIDWPSHQFRDSTFVPAERHEPGKFGSGQWDLPRMKEGGLDAAFMSIFTSQGPRTDEGHANAKERALKLIELTKKMVADNPDLAEIAFAPEDAYRIEKAGKRAIFMGMENGCPSAKTSATSKCSTVSACATSR
jgi:membrane dipeptidase